MINDYLLENLKFPIGEFQIPANFDVNQYYKIIEAVSTFSKSVQNLFQNCSENQLDFRYRSNGLIVKQAVNHSANRHMNAFLGIKLALLEYRLLITLYHKAPGA